VAVDQLLSDRAAGRLGLFVGAGLSAQLGLPPWSGLIERMGDELGYERALFFTLGDYPELAEYYAQHKGLSLLVEWLRKHWRDAPIDVSKSRAHEVVAKLQLPIIYTTNYDPWLERAHEAFGVPFRRVVVAEDIATVRDGETQIVKFHGDLDDPDTLVVTQSHYFERLQFESALDLKLRADMLRYSLLFVGYSLSDINIRLMLHRLALLRAGRTESPMRSFIVLNRQNPVQREILSQWNVEVLYLKDLEPGTGLTAFLEGLDAGDVSSLLLHP
jgi:hypothetical protein